MKKRVSERPPVRKTRDITYGRPGHVIVDPEKVRARMSAMGFRSETELADAIEMSRGTTYRMLTLRYIKRRNLEDVAKVLKTTVESLCPDSSYQENPEPTATIPAPNDWTIIGFESSFVVAANGVSYCAAKLQSQLVETRFARGKYYCLLNVSPSKYTDLRERLVRHPTVCERLKHSQYIIRNREIRRLGQDSAWWVLDEWNDDASLESIVESEQRLTQETIKQIGSGMLRGLADLHAAQIVMRELAPERVFVSADGNRCTLADFELAKLFSGNPSVSGDWKTSSPYRAPEIDDESTSSQIDKYLRCDFFSWAAILIELLTGDPDATLESISSEIQDNETAALLINCRHPQYSRRPASAEAILEIWEKWTPKK